MQVTLSRVVEAARQRKAAVTAEAGGYIILLAVQRLAPQPRHIDAELIQLTATGEILIENSGPTHAAEAEGELRRLLATLVSLSHTAPPALRAAAERPATGSLAALEGELTAALIPINHAASGRALARLFRETDKALPGSASTSAAASSATPSSAGALLAVAPSPPLPTVVVASEPGPSSAQASPPASSAPAELGELDIDVEVVASDDAELDVMPSSVAPAGAASTAPAALPVPSNAPQLIVEELDELDVHELDLLEEEGQPGLEELAAAVAAPPLESAPTAPALSRESEELLLEAHEAADELDRLLAEELPPTPAPRQEQELRLDVAPVSGEVSTYDFPPGPAPARAAPLRDPGTESQLSDLRELLARFLAHTRCEEEMTANLRRMVGLEPWRASGALEGPKMGPSEAPASTP